MDCNTIIKHWNDALISTGEALSQILYSNNTVEKKLEAIATITLELLKEERKAAGKEIDLIKLLDNESLRWDFEENDL